jgi:hypothetical protein
LLLFFTVYTGKKKHINYEELTMVAIVGDFQSTYKKKKSYTSSIGSATDAPPPPSNVNAIDLAYLMIFHANEIEQHSVQISAKMVTSNISAQEFLNNCLNHIEFWTMPPYAFQAGNASKVDLTDLQIKNDQITASRENCTNGLNLLRQANAINTAELNTKTDVCQQDVSQASDIMQILWALTSQINRS